MPKVTAASDLALARKGRAGAAAGKGAPPARGAVGGGNKKLKFKYCMYHLQGVCKYTSNECSFAHSMEDIHHAKKSQAAGGKRSPLTGSGDELSSDGELSKPTAGLSSIPFDHRGGSVYRGLGAADRQSNSNAWPQLEEPMFVKTLHPHLKHDVTAAAAAPVYDTGLGLPHDPEQYLDFSLMASPYAACLPADLAKHAKTPGDFYAANPYAANPMHLDSLALQQMHLKGIANPSFDARYKASQGFMLDTNRGPSAGAAGVAMPNLYTMPNPFVGLDELMVTSTPAPTPPPGLGLACALGA